jgi:hypothetical protein
MIMVKLRHVAGVRYDETSTRYGLTEVAKALNCIWCLSVWVATFLTVAFVLYPATLYLVVPLALSALAILIQEHLHG